MAHQGEIGMSIYFWTKNYDEVQVHLRVQKDIRLKFHRKSFCAMHGGCVAMKYIQEWEVRESDMHPHHRQMGRKVRVLAQNTTKPNKCNPTR